MRTIVFLLLLSVVFYSCKNQPQVENSIPKTDSLDNYVPSFITDSSKKITIQFSEFSFEVFGVSIFEKQQDAGIPILSQKDTVQVWLDFENEITGNYLKIHSENLKDVFVLQKFRNSLLLNNGQNYLLFSDGKHYVSAWDTIPEINKGGYYKSDVYNAEQKELFPETSEKELLDLVKTAGGNEWLPLIKDTKNVHEKPFGIFTDRVTFQVNGLFNGRSISKTIIFIQQKKGKV